jgi:hypothetical protein
MMRIRDTRAGGWFYVHNELIRRFGAEIGEAGIAVYCVLAMAAGTRGVERVSGNKIAHLLGVSRPHVSHVLCELEARGIIAVERASGRINMITLTAPTEWHAPGEVGAKSQPESQAEPQSEPQPEPRPRSEPGRVSQGLAFDTPGAKLLQRLLTESARAAGRRGPQRFKTLEAKRRWLDVEQRLGARLEQELRRALAQEINSIPRLTSYLLRVAENSNGKAQPQSAKPATKLFRAE